MSKLKRSSRPDVVDAAKSVVAELSANRDFGKTRGELAPESIEALKRSGMLSLWRPQALEGLECDPVAYAMAAEQIAVGDSASAWLMHGVSATWFDLRQGHPDLVDEIVASAAIPVLGETFNKPMKAVAVDGGYQVTGSTPFASGCMFSDWMGHTAMAGDQLLLVYHPKGNLEIKEEWDSLGMRGTASNTIIANEVFVPSHRTINLTTPVNRSSRFSGPLYRMPEGVIPVAVAAVSLGVLRMALDVATEIVDKKTAFASQSTLKHHPLAQLQFGRALATYRAARSYLHSCLAEAFEQAQKDNTFDLRGKADLFLTYAHTVQSCLEAVRLIVKIVGTWSIYKRSPIERALRDVEVISHHAFGAEVRYASAAQAYWDLDVDFPLLAMD